jgi:hypothetical protein
MLERATNPGADRARRSRARLRAGIRTFKVQAHSRRLVAAMRLANSGLGDDLDQAAIERELDAIIGAFVDRWLQPKKPCA